MDESNCRWKISTLAWWPGGLACIQKLSGTRHQIVRLQAPNRIVRHQAARLQAPNGQASGTNCTPQKEKRQQSPDVNKSTEQERKERAPASAKLNMARHT
jgi:hypothetical protein